MSKLIISGNNKELFEIEEKRLLNDDIKNFLLKINDEINKINIQNNPKTNKRYMIFCQSSTIKEQIELEIQKLNLPCDFEYIIYPYCDKK